MKFNRLSIIIILFSILTACNLGIDSNKKVDDSMITIGFTGNSDLLDNSSRVISVNTPTISEYELYGAFTNETKTLLGTFSDLAGASVTIKKGTWDFTLKAKNSTSQYILEGSLDAVVLTDSADTLAFDLVPLTTGSGTVNFTINIPASVNIDSVVTELDGTVQTPALTVVNSKVIYSNSSLGIGNYMLSIKMLNAAGEALCTVTELVQVLPNFISTKEITLTDADFEKAPVAPSDFAVTVGNSSDNTYAKLNFTWSDNSNNETGFQIFKSDGITLVGEVGGGITSFTWDKADRGLTYRFKVRSKNSFCESSFSSTISVKTPVRLKFEDSKNSNTTYQEVVPGVIIVPPAVSHEPYWFFDGWYDDIWVGEKLDNTPCPDTNMIYNANWTKPNFNITFNKNGADGTETMPVLSRQYGSSVALTQNTFTNSDYVFAGWSTTSNGAVEYADKELFTVGPADIELFAVWKNTLTYSGNVNTSGTVPVDNTLFSENDTVTLLSADTLKKDGFILSGWNTAANGSGTQYYPGDVLTFANSNITLYARWISNTSFISKWRTTADGEFIELPLTYGGTYNFTVDWGDGTSDTITNKSDAAVKHTYAKAGDYTVIITGVISGWTFGESFTSSNLNIIEISNWGSLAFGNYEEHFKSCENLKITATDKPDISATTSFYRSFYNCRSLEDIPGIKLWDVINITNMSEMFRSCYLFDGDLSGWKTDNVTDMSYMFSGCNVFTSDLSGWNTINVTDMSYLFNDCYVFTSNLSDWKTINVTSMRSMFDSAREFNSDLSRWNVSNVTTLQNMFYYAYKFNSELTNWETTNVTNLYGTFDFAESFNPTSLGWDTTNVTTFARLFRGAVLFNADISGWKTSNVTDLSSTFDRAESFNRDISGWDISNVTSLHDTFYGAKLFNADISGWKTLNVTSMYRTFNGCTSFNRDISGWVTSKVKNMSGTFRGMDMTNIDLSSWNTSSVTSMSDMFAYSKNNRTDFTNWITSNVTDMSGMFKYSPDFNEATIANFDTSNVKNMRYMFEGSGAFDQDISNWNYSQVTEMKYFLSDSVFSSDNYNKLLVSLSNQTLQPGVILYAKSSYTTDEAETARNKIINDFSWSISDSGRK